MVEEGTGVDVGRDGPVNGMLDCAWREMFIVISYFPDLFKPKSIVLYTN